MLAPDNGGGSGGGAQTLEEQLSQARNDLATAQASVSSLTIERDKATGDLATATKECDNMRSQFDELTTTANDLRTQVNTLTSERDTARTELGASNDNLTRANANVTRLEKLCGVKGIDHKNAVPAVDDPQNAKSVAELADAVRSATTQTERMKAHNVWLAAQPAA